MENAETTYERIIQIVNSWPAHRRFTLVQDVLKTLEPNSQVAPRRRDTLKQALGFLATSRAAPSDQEVAQWLDEHRVEKYG